MELYENIKNRELDLATDEQLEKRNATGDFKDLVSRLLHKDPAKRLGA